MVVYHIVVTNSEVSITWGKGGNWCGLIKILINWALQAAISQFPWQYMCQITIDICRLRVDRDIFFVSLGDSTRNFGLFYVECDRQYGSRLGQSSRHLFAVSVGFFFSWLKSNNSAVSPWKRILFSANFHSIQQLPWVPWIFWLK